MKICFYFFILCCFFTSCVSADGSSMRWPEESNSEQKTATGGMCQVTKVIDGDTFWVADGSEKYKVRFIGVDAPETRNSRWKQKGKLAAEAKAFVKNLTEGKSVRLELDVQHKDRYQRILAYVYLADGTFLNAELLKAGYAVVDTYPPNVKYVELFTELQTEARKQQVGLWADRALAY
ncbi:thermonuclease family protein [Sphingobacterium griseoflavum]|nr:thermonuclease family protein [Sphingobacterium griseoflavum]